MNTASNIKQMLAKHGLNQVKIAKKLQVSPATINLIVKHGKYPKQGAEQLKAQLQHYLSQHGVSSDIIQSLTENATENATENLAENVTNNPSDNADEDNIMLLRKQSLSPQARKQFKLSQNIFTEPVRHANQVFSNDSLNDIREALWQTAKGNSSFIAIIGQSGAGKSTLRRELIDRIERQGEHTVVIEPYVLATEDNDIKGKTLKSVHIAEAMLATLAPSENAKRSPEARFRQVHHLLKESSRAGNHHLLIIEEAHSLPIPTLKHLKRFLELENGFTPLLSIVLIGQNELENKLSKNNEAVREVVQRCEIHYIEPLNAQSLKDYLQHRCQCVGRNLDELIDDTGLQAIFEKLTRSTRNKPQESLLYPLAVGNLLTGALNIASDLGLPIVTGELVKEV